MEQRKIMIRNKSNVRAYPQRSISPTNAPRGFYVETTWKGSFPRRFNVESTWRVCQFLFFPTFLTKIIQRLFLTFFRFLNFLRHLHRSNPPEVFLRKCVLKISSNFTGEHRYWNLISIKLLCNFIEVTLRCGCSPVNLLYIFRKPFCKNTYWRLLLLTVP